MKDFDKWYEEHVGNIISDEHPAHNSPTVKRMKEYLRRGWRECARIKDEEISALQEKIEELESKIVDERSIQENLNLEIYTLKNQIKTIEKNSKKR